jgi:uncharacterized membrane protein
LVESINRIRHSPFPLYTRNHYNPVTADQSGIVRFDVTNFADGEARYYRYQGRTGPVDFFVVRSHDGIIRAAYDSCDVCYREGLGYRQEGDQMVCNNCDQRFRTDLVNVVKGGCNPAPLRRQKVGDEIHIQAADIERGIRYFASSVN